MALRHIEGERITWIDIIHPTMQDVEVLRRTYPFIHPLNLEDIVSVQERPKIDDDPDYIYVVMHFPLWDPVNRLSRSREVDFIVGRGFIITVHDGTLRPLGRLYQNCINDSEHCAKLLDSTAGHALYVMIDDLVDYIQPILRRVDANISRIEDSIFDEQSLEVVREISLVRRDIIALRRIIRQQVPILENLQRVERRIIQEELDEYFGDIVDHIYQARDIIDEDAEVIANLSDTADKLANHRINSVIRVLTVISVIMLPLTLIAGVFGMNVDLPFDEQEHAFEIIMFIMFMITVAMLIVFRSRKWI